jgi:excisionase family DNA binding protein
MKKKQEPVPPRPTPPPLAKVLFTVEEAAFITSSGRTAIFKALEDGRLRGVKDGDRTKLTGEAISDFIAQMPPWKPRRKAGGEVAA